MLSKLPPAARLLLPSAAEIADYYTHMGLDAEARMLKYARV